MKFEENLAVVHAYLCADGYVIKNPENQKHKYYYIGFRNTNLFLLRDFQKRFKEYFGVEPRLNEGERCVLQKKELYKRLVSKFGSFYSREWKMPLLKRNLSKKWLRAFFDCEGWVVCESHQNRHIGADSVNEKGLLQIKKALKKLGIKSQIKKRSDRDIFTLKIYGKKNLTKFEKNIGFLHPKKKEKLKEAINDYVNYYWNFPDKKIELRKFIRKIMLKKARMGLGNKIIRLCSNKEENIQKLNLYLEKIYGIESRIGKRKNGVGTIYFELCINKHKEVEKAIKNKLLNANIAQKWLKLKK